MAVAVYLAWYAAMDAQPVTLDRLFDTPAASMVWQTSAGVKVGFSRLLMVGAAAMIVIAIKIPCWLLHLLLMNYHVHSKERWPSG